MISIRRRRSVRIPFRTGACAVLLAGVALTVPAGGSSAAPDDTAAAGLTRPAGCKISSSSLADAKATVDAATTRAATSVNQAAAGLQAFVKQAGIAGDKSMKAAGAAAKAALDRQITRLLTDAGCAIPDLASLEPRWDPAAVDACVQADGTILVSKGTAVCTTNADRDDRARARAEGAGASADADAVHTGDARAAAAGDGSKAAAKSGDKARTGQAGNVSNAISTGRSTATANSGLGDFDERNNSTAAAAGGSLSTSDASGGDRNQTFAGSFDNGEAHATSTAGDGNLSLALGADGGNDGNGPAGAQSTTLIGFDDKALSVADGVNSTAITNAGYGDRHEAAASSGPDSQARADSAQGEDSAAFATATDRGHALAFNSYGDDMLAVARSKGDGSTGLCNPIGQPVNSGETTYPLDACATASSRAVDGQTNTAISVVDKAKAYSVAERGRYNTAVTTATNGGDIIWNTTASLPGQPANPHAGLTPDCPWPLPPPPQAQQACGNATAKASYGDGNLAVAAPDGDHAFAWSEASGGSYNQTLATAEARSKARARAIYDNYGTAKAAATGGGNADSIAVLGYQNVALANAAGTGSVADASAAGNHARATATASSGGTATAVHNTSTTTAFLPGIPLTTGVSCSDTSVTYAVIGTGQSCGTGF